MRIAVTGGLGHVGAYLINQIQQYVSVSAIRVVDDASTGSLNVLTALNPSSAAQFVQADVCSPRIVDALRGADVVIHLAALTDAAGNFNKPEMMNRINFLGTKSVAEACLELDLPLFFPSTTSVYGSAEEVLDESSGADSLRPQSPYADSKLRAEGLLLEMHASKSLRVVIVRLGTIFGWSPGMRFHTAVNKFCLQAATGQPLTVWSSAWEQRRPYLGLGDFVRALSLILKEEAFSGQIYNIVSENQSVEHMVSKLRTIVPSLEVKFVDSPIMNQLSYEVSSAKIESLGFCPSQKLVAGIQETMDKFSALLRTEEVP